jgi:hypothetical protein
MCDRFLAGTTAPLRRRRLAARLAPLQKLHPFCPVWGQPFRAAAGLMPGVTAASFRNHGAGRRPAARVSLRSEAVLQHIITGAHAQ